MRVRTLDKLVLGRGLSLMEGAPGRMDVSIDFSGWHLRPLGLLRESPTRAPNLDFCAYPNRLGRNYRL